MKRRFSRKPPPPCAEFGPEDGIDPRLTVRPARSRVPNRKALQLCAQVARTLSCALATECADDILQELLVASVQPAPDSTRLLIVVSPAPFAPAREPAQILEHLHRASGLLRSLIAAAIHRKRVPELVFSVSAGPNE
jgi:ribosome-binding factor A